jgi:hypothetical protein
MYVLEFNKISNNHKFAGVGFAGNIFIVLNALTEINDNQKLFVDMKKNQCVCTESDDFIYNTKNCWEYYFNQNEYPKNVKRIFDSVTCGTMSYNDQNLFINSERFINLKNKFFNSFSLKDNIKSEVDNFYDINLKNKKTLGIQIRLTDMKHFNNVSGLDNYINTIKKILNDNKEIEQLFISTDDINAIEKIKNLFDIPVLYHKNFYRADNIKKNLDPYERHDYIRQHHNYTLSKECLVEVLTLTKCNYFLKADVSALSMVAIILSERIEKVYKNDLYNW